MSQIPTEIKDKIEANKPDVGLLAHKAAWDLMFANKLTISRRDDYRNGYYTGWHVGAEFGYSLAAKEITELKAEIERLKKVDICNYVATIEFMHWPPNESLLKIYPKDKFIYYPITDLHWLFRADGTQTEYWFEKVDMGVFLQKWCVKIIDSKQ